MSDTQIETEEQVGETVSPAAVPGEGPDPAANKQDLRRSTAGVIEGPIPYMGRDVKTNPDASTQEAGGPTVDDNQTKSIDADQTQSENPDETVSEADSMTQD
jgi:hypothetical protein